MATDQRKVWRIKALPTFILLIGLQIWLSESQTVTPTPSQPNQNNIDESNMSDIATDITVSVLTLEHNTTSATQSLHSDSNVAGTIIGVSQLVVVNKSSKGDLLAPTMDIPPDMSHTAISSSAMLLFPDYRSHSDTPSQKMSVSHTAPPPPTSSIVDLVTKETDSATKVMAIPNQSIPSDSSSVVIDLKTASTMNSETFQKLQNNQSTIIATSSSASVDTEPSVLQSVTQIYPPPTVSSPYPMPIPTHSLHTIASGMSDDTHNTASLSLTLTVPTHTLPQPTAAVMASVSEDVLLSRNPSLSENSEFLSELMQSSLMPSSPLPPVGNSSEISIVPDLLQTSASTLSSLMTHPWLSSLTTIFPSEPFPGLSTSLYHSHSELQITNKPTSRIIKTPSLVTSNVIAASNTNNATPFSLQVIMTTVNNTVSLTKATSRYDFSNSALHNPGQSSRNDVVSSVSGSSGRTVTAPSVAIQDKTQTPNVMSYSMHTTMSDTLPSSLTDILTTSNASMSGQYDPVFRTVENTMSQQSSMYRTSTATETRNVVLSESSMRTEGQRSIQPSSSSRLESVHVANTSTPKLAISLVPTPFQGEAITMTTSTTMPTPSLSAIPSVSSSSQAFVPSSISTIEFPAPVESSSLIGSHSSSPPYARVVNQSEMHLESKFTIMSTGRSVEPITAESTGIGQGVIQSESSSYMLHKSLTYEDSTPPGLQQTTAFVSAADITPSASLFADVPFSSNHNNFFSVDPSSVTAITDHSSTVAPSETLTSQTASIASSVSPSISPITSSSIVLGSSSSTAPSLTTALPTSSILSQSSTNHVDAVSPTPSIPIPMMSSTLLPGTTAATTKRPTTTVPSTTPGIEYWTLEKGLETQPYWLATVITVPTNQDIRDLLFIIELEQGFAEAYQEGMQRESQENREIQELLQQLDPDINPLVMDRRKKRATSHGSYTVQMIDQIRDNLTPTSVSLVFYVTEGGTKYRKVAAQTSSAIYGRLSLSELTFFVGYPMESEVKDYNAMINPTGTPVPPAQSNNLWIIAAVLVPFFVIFLCVCCCCCMMMQKKRDTDIDPDTLKIIQFKQKYPYRPYQPANTPRGFDVAKNGIDNQGMVVGDGTGTTKTGFHVENDLDDGLTRSAPKTDGFIPSETDSSINLENDIAATQKRPLPPRGTKNGGLFDGQPPPYPGRLPPLNTEDTKKSKQKKKRRRKKGVGPSDVDESTTGRTAADEDHPSSEFKPTSLDGLPETHLSRPPLPSSTDDENSQELDSETQKRLQSLFDDANPLADNAELTEDHAQMPSLIHVESSDPSQVYGTQNDLFAKKEGPKILIVPVTKVPDNGGGVVWSTYDAFDEVDKITTKKEPSSSPRNKNEPKPLTLTSPHTGAELTLQISETPREPSKDKVKEGTTQWIRCFW
ncbi:uncharacterized protein [Ptychodera flava]|uniref:uncharacterized protein isoform X2 n=1 Tax=Ptychodera flava TaxID=63121 RepID=UPI003969D62D